MGSPAFLLMAVLMIFDIACAALIKIPPVERQTSVWAGVLNILCQPRVAVFLIWCFGCGLLTSVIWQWLLWYLSDLATKESTSSCGDSQSWVTTLLGINMAVQCFVGEVPMFFLSGVATGSLIGGAIYQNYGGVFLFRCASIFALALAMLHIAAQCWLSRSDKDRAREMKIETEEEPALLNHSDM